MSTPTQPTPTPMPTILTIEPSPAAQRVMQQFRPGKYMFATSFDLRDALFELSEDEQHDIVEYELRLILASLAEQFPTVDLDEVLEELILRAQRHQFYGQDFIFSVREDCGCIIGTCVLVGARGIARNRQLEYLMFADEARMLSVNIAHPAREKAGEYTGTLGMFAVERMIQFMHPDSNPREGEQRVLQIIIDVCEDLLAELHQPQQPQA